VDICFPFLPSLAHSLFFGGSNNYSGPEPVSHYPANHWGRIDQGKWRMWDHSQKFRNKYCFTHTHFTQSSPQ
jgi:hypothetical protein